MNRLTAYGSDSEGSDVESAPVVKTVASRPQAPRETVLPPKTDVPKSALDLPKATTTNQNLFKPKEDSENELESIVQRREWEIKLAEKEKKNFRRSKRKIDAFGGLSKNALEAVVEDDVIQKPTSKPVSTNNSTSKLLSMLPPPKSTVDFSAKPSTSILSLKPSSVKSISMKTETKRAKMDDGVDETTSTASTADDDFLGLGSVQKKDLLDARKLPRRELPTPNIFVVEEEIGPVRPQPAVAESNNAAELTVNYKSISDEAARQLIYKQEVETWGASSVFANEAVMNIVDVNVDREIGSNVRETLLKNLDYKNVAAFAVGRPQKPTVKDASEKLAKMKHQITHLASIAVAREDQLKEQWAQSKAAKVASKQKYGF